MGNAQDANFKKAKYKKSKEKYKTFKETKPDQGKKPTPMERKMSNPIPIPFYETEKREEIVGNIPNIEDCSPMSDKRKNKINIDVKGGSFNYDIRKVYKFKDVLGGGHFGSVRIAYRRDAPDKFYAIKSIQTKNISKEDMDDLMREVEIISQLKHPNIIRFYETYHDDHYFHIVMELCTGQEVFEKIINDGNITERTVGDIISKVLHAIAYCHSMGITHRDLKPENILFESNKPNAEVKIIDFGLSRKYYSNEKMHTILGTPFYIAPEVLKGEYDEKCDVWSIGALTYIMLSGQPPFNGNTNNEIFNNIMDAPLMFPAEVFEHISPEAVNFIKHCMAKEPSDRYTAVEALKDPWFKNILDKEHNEEHLAPEILSNLKNFSRPEKFKTLVLNFIANNVSERELYKLKNAFNAIDTNHSGHINTKELEIAFKSTGMEMTEDELGSIVDSVGDKTDGKIEYNEFIMACMNQKKNMRREKLEQAFKYFDVDNSGFIDSSDIKNALLRSGQKIVNEEVIAKILSEVCKDNKGKISLEDFLKLFEKEELKEE